MEWKKEYGDRKAFGDIGGAGLELEVTIQNSAWLRVGLFGGGFGIDLYNRGYAGAYLVSLDIPIFDAGIQFKLDASYRVDIPADVLKVVDTVVDVADGVISTFESAKAYALSFVWKFVEFAYGILDVVDDFLDGLPDTVIDALSKALPFLTKSSADVAGDVAGAIGNSSFFCSKGMAKFAAVAEKFDGFASGVHEFLNTNCVVEKVRDGMEIAEEVLEQRPAAQGEHRRTLL